MNNETLNNSLVEIEKNLKKLESARTQVNNVSEKSEILVKEVSILISKVNHLQNEFEVERSGLHETLINSIEKFKNSLQSESNTFIDKSKQISSSFADSVSNNTVILKGFQQKIQDAEEKIARLDFEKGFSELKRNTNVKFESLSTNISDSVNSLKIEQKYSQSDLVKILKNQKKELSKLKTILFVIIGVIIIGFAAMFFMFNR